MGGYRGTSGDHTVTQVRRRELFPPRGTLGGESCIEVASREVTFRRGAQPARGGPHLGQVGRGIHSLILFCTLPQSRWGSPLAASREERRKEGLGSAWRVYSQGEWKTLHPRTGLELGICALSTKQPSFSLVGPGSA